jgi:hypothetical protein
VAERLMAALDLSKPPISDLRGQGQQMILTLNMTDYNFKVLFFKVTIIFYVTLNWHYRPSFRLLKAESAIICLAEGA